MTASTLTSLALALTGALLVVNAVARSRRVAFDVVEYVTGTDDGGEEEVALPVDEFERALREPFTRRMANAVGGRVVERLSVLMPRNYLDGVHRKLTIAGRRGARAAEGLVAAQAVLTAVVLAVALLFVRASGASGKGLLLVVILPLVAALLPVARLSRQVSERQEAIRRDLPETLDLLAIAVEAGIGFEGALDVVCQHFQSPLGEEFALTLRQMELGLPRREAFQDLRSRTQVPELSNFIVALLQGDALGIPVGRILKTQAIEMRSQRRMWAREKAGKLPVKILFPLVMFIFPPIMVIVIGPAAASLIGGGLA